eukprot:3571758-Rhodomonas_salina.4
MARCRTQICLSGMGSSIPRTLWTSSQCRSALSKRLVTCVSGLVDESWVSRVWVCRVWGKGTRILLPSGSMRPPTIASLR